MFFFSRFCLSTAPSRVAHPGKVLVKQAAKRIQTPSGKLSNVTAMLKKITPKERLHVASTAKNLSGKKKFLPVSPPLAAPLPKTVPTPKIKSAVILPRRTIGGKGAVEKKHIAPPRSKAVALAPRAKSPIPRVSTTTTKAEEINPSLARSGQPVHFLFYLPSTFNGQQNSVSRSKNMLTINEVTKTLKRKLSSMLGPDTKAASKVKPVEKKHWTLSKPRTPARFPIKVKKSVFALRATNKYAPVLQRSPFSAKVKIPTAALSKIKAVKKAAPLRAAPKKLQKKVIEMKENIKRKEDKKERVTLPISHKVVKSFSPAKKVLFKPIPVKHNVFSPAIRKQPAHTSDPHHQKLKK